MAAQRLPYVETVVVQVRAPLDPGEVGRLQRRVEALLDGGRCAVVCELSGPVDVAVVDLLARVALRARRGGADVHLRASGGALEDVLALCGLQDAVRAALQPVGQPEAGEQPGVEEVVDVHDAPG